MENKRVGWAKGDKLKDYPLRLEWFDLHQQELLDAWERVQAGFPPKKIAPLE